MSQPPQIIIDLVEKFERHLDAYRSSAYNEAMLRLEFIDPMFEALGWDMYNKSGYSQAFRDVIHEDAIRIGGATEAPDYCFRIGGTRKFFLEAKKPSVDIKGAIHPAYQLRRYAWSAKLPLSILTDFEELAVYDCRVRPKPTDKAGTSRTLYFDYHEYLDRWVEIAGIFSKEAVLKGSFDKYVESFRKRGTSEIDSEFLTEIETWREMLARNIALRNPGLSVRELNFSVQKIIDRIIFLRMCEDRGIETYGQLQALLNGQNTFARLQYLFGLADDKYNSGLFHFRPEKGRAAAPDELTPSLVIDDKAIKDIVRRLYYPESPYEFSVLSADILGNVYEQFLGKVIRLTPANRAVVEEKPEVKKAGGVYYTPTYIVDYIVKNTVGRLVGADLCVGPEGKGKHTGLPLQPLTPTHISKLRILDPACGSGSFLIGAFTFLMDYHRDWYVKNEPKRHTKQIYQGPGGQWFLTTQEKKRILLNNIYGVDIDSQAVEVTKLSLLLKVLEGENQDSLEMQQKLFRERALPDLASNVKCGNSLIGPDFYEGGQMDLLNDEECYRINVFDWNKEFSEIMNSGGFDAVIGNPPYIQSRSGRLAETDKVYYAIHYETVKYQINTYGLFLERGMNLLRPNGRLGFIIPNYWLSTDSDEPLRNFLFLRNDVVEIVNVYNVFDSATVDTLLLTVLRRRSNSFPKECLIRSVDRSLRTIAERLAAVHNGEWAHEKTYAVNSGDQDILISFSSTIELRGDASLADYFSFKFGMKPYEKGKGIPPQTTEMMVQRIYDAKGKIDASYRPLLRARNVKRYNLIWEGDHIKYGENLAAPRDPRIFAGQRILIQRIVSGNHVDGTYTDESFICNTDVITLKPLFDPKDISLQFFLGILESRLCSAFLKSRNVNLDRAAFPKINANTLEKFPIPRIRKTNKADKISHDHMARLVEKMLDLHKQLAKAKTPDEKGNLQRQIDATDHQIDQLVYELYGLTEEEIAIVEGRGK